MGNTNYAGIDYGMGTTNRDPETGISYGLISPNSLPEWWYEAEMVYPTDCECISDDCGFKHAGCDLCDSALDGDKFAVAAIKGTGDNFEQIDLEVCMDCRMYIANADLGDEEYWNQDSCDETIFSYRDKGYDIVNSKDTNGECYCGPVGARMESDGVLLEAHGDMTEVWVMKSPVYTFAQFCSPCMPGAGNLDSPCDAGQRTYAIPLDWFTEDRPAPYDTIRNVADWVENKQYVDDNLEKFGY